MKHLWLGPLFAVLSLLLVGICGELIARIVLPPQQSVQIENVKPFERPIGTPQVVEGSGRIDSVFEWGPQGIRLRPNIRATIHKHTLSGEDVRIDVNSLGLRYPELGEKASSEYRVLVLGDSITIGDYVQANETYPSKLEDLAKAQGKSTLFINGGLPGASLSSEIYRYMEVKDQVRPDLVLVGMYLNDSSESEILITQGVPSWIRGSRLLTWAVNRLEFLRKRLWKSPSPLPQIEPTWHEEFRAGRKLHSGDMLNDPDAMDFEVYNAPMDFGRAWNPASWEIIKSQLSVLSQETKRSGSKLAVFLLPVHFQVKASFEDRRPQESFLKVCKGLGIECLDVLPGLRSEWKVNQTQLYYDHCHYRPYGNALVANIVYPWLQRGGLIPG